MVHLYWDFEKNKELKKFDPLLRVELIHELHTQLKIPLWDAYGFDKPYIEIESNDPVINHPLFKSKIPRAGYIQRVAVRHLTYQSQEFINKIQEIAKKVFQTPEKGD